MLRGIRGAITAEKNGKKEILGATQELLRKMLDENQITSDQIASIIFSMTPDLNAEFPAAAARQMGLSLVPLFCVSEIAKPGGLQKCIRILIHMNTEKDLSGIKHIYLKGARVLREEYKA
jgi:chorismate mutase